MAERTEFPHGYVARRSALDLSDLVPPQMIVTSPPYWGKRSYEEAGKEIWGGDPNCEHDFSLSSPPPRRRSNADAEHEGCIKRVGIEVYDAVPSAFCSKCGAHLCQLGQENTPQEFAEHLADIFAGIPMRDDATVWVNIMDTYVSAKGKSGAAGVDTGRRRKDGGETMQKAESNVGGHGVTAPGDDVAELRKWNLKGKDLACVPWRFAMAMQARGFYYRAEIIWDKENTMPCSVQDRPWVSHEQILVFSKNAKYKFNPMALEIPVQSSSAARLMKPIPEFGNYWENKGEGKDNEGGGSPRMQGRRQKWAGHPNQQTIHKRRMAGGGEYVAPESGKYGTEEGAKDGLDFRKPRSVWRMPTSNHSSKVSAHIAPMPIDIPLRCIPLGSDKGDVVLDPFAGTGTVCLAAAKLERRFIGTDKDPRLPEFLREWYGRMPELKSGNLGFGV